MFVYFSKILFILVYRWIDAFILSYRCHCGEQHNARHSQRTCQWTHFLAQHRTGMSTQMYSNVLLCKSWRWLYHIFNSFLSFDVIMATSFGRCNMATRSYVERKSLFCLLSFKYWTLFFAQLFQLFLPIIFQKVISFILLIYLLFSQSLP